MVCLTLERKENAIQFTRFYMIFWRIHCFIRFAPILISSDLNEFELDKFELDGVIPVLVWPLFVDMCAIVGGNRLLNHTPDFFKNFKQNGKIFNLFILINNNIETNYYLLRHGIRHKFDTTIWSIVCWARVNRSNTLDIHSENTTLYRLLSAIFKTKTKQKKRIFLDY